MDSWPGQLHSWLRAPDNGAGRSSKQLKALYLNASPNLTRAQIDKFKKALPKREIFRNAKT